MASETIQTNALGEHIMALQGNSNREGTCFKIALRTVQINYKRHQDIGNQLYVPCCGSKMKIKTREYVIRIRRWHVDLMVTGILDTNT